MNTTAASHPGEKIQRESPSPLLRPEDCLDIYYHMCLARGFEERAVILYRQGRLVGPLYTGIGAEATAVGSAYTLDDGDVIAPLHRDIGTQFVRGTMPAEVYAQYMGRITGPSRGRDSATHIGNMNRRIISMVSHLGVMIPMMAGVALASRLTSGGYVAMTYIGDGGSSNGDFHEGLNFAAVRKLPLIVIIENNQFAYSTPTRHQYACEHLADRAVGYGIPGVTLDGTDVIEVYEACKHAVDRARAGKGPTLIEARLMRLHGHSEHDDASYVPKETLEAGWKNDPVPRFERRLREYEILTDDVKAGLEQRIAREIDEAVTTAEASPWPEPEDALTGVYAE